MNSPPPSFLGSPGNTSVSGPSRGQYVLNRLHKVEDDQEEIEDDQDQTLSTQGDSSPHRAQPGTPQSVRRPQAPPGPSNFVVPRAPQGIATLEPLDPFATI